MKFLYFFIYISTALNISAGAQIITTYAGTAAAGFSGDGMPATSAQLNRPWGLANDNAGNLVIADQYNNRIRKVDAVGVISTIAGTGTTAVTIADGTLATAADIYRPNSLAIDAAGNIYFKFYTSVVEKINLAGIITRVAGSDATFGFSGDGGPATAALLSSSLNNIAIDAAGNIYIADWGNKRLRMINTSGIIATVAGNGVAGYSGDGGPATAASLNPRAMAIDIVGNVYISDWNNHVIRKVNAITGIISTVAGTGIGGFSGDGGPATAAMLYEPEQIAIDSAGNLFICDHSNKRLRKIDPAGIITTIAGNGTIAYAGDGGPATACSFESLVGIAIRSGCGEHIYISDKNSIREIVYYNALPIFTSEHSNHITVCEGTGPFDLDTLLTMSDADASQPETWALISPAAHGTVVAAYSATSTGGSITPSGLSYTPAAGYTGTDTFRVAVTDCGNAPDTATFYVTVNPLPVAGVIKNIEGGLGVDTVCVGDIMLLTDTVAGGVWGVYHGKAGVSVTGSVTGIAPGVDTISYTVTDACGIAVATRPIIVKDCYVGVGDPRVPRYGTLVVFPNANPGSFSILLNTATAEDAHIIITNVAGQVVRQFSLPSNTKAGIQLSVPVGLYFVSAVTAHGKWVQKVVVNP